MDIENGIAQNFTEREKHALAPDLPDDKMALGVLKGVLARHIEKTGGVLDAVQDGRPSSLSPAIVNQAEQDWQVLASMRDHVTVHDIGVAS